MEHLHPREGPAPHTSGNELQDLLDLLKGQRLVKNGHLKDYHDRDETQGFVIREKGSPLPRLMNGSNDELVVLDAEFAMFCCEVYKKEIGMETALIQVSL